MDHTIGLSPTAIGYEMNPLDTVVLRADAMTQENKDIEAGEMGML